jgi:hypothetical protein
VARIERIIVGYREGDPKIAQLWDENRHRALPHKGCISCGALTYFVESGQDAIRNRDPEPICQRCWDDPQIKRQIYATEL